MTGDFLILTEWSDRKCVVAMDQIIYVSSVQTHGAYGGRVITVVHTTGGSFEVKDSVEDVIKLLSK